ncbi:hypothetical protein [Ureibacillus thermosphaericus]|uniref:hypothetical protein n=1 Tax=Ureibacillus thermosphaericus TaxID=51173 RepID=UPI0030C9E2E0
MCNTPKYPTIPILTSHCKHDLEQKMANTFVCEDRVIPFYNENVELEKIVVFSRDTTVQKALEEKLEELSYYDSLTGLFNRNYYEKREAKLNSFDNRSLASLYVIWKI